MTFFAILNLITCFSLGWSLGLLVAFRQEKNAQRKTRLTQKLNRAIRANPKPLEN